jgi:TetR/AcrR family transcriptional regulator, transcriptional repressor of bet genes
LGDATLGRIAEEVGITAANINHYFGGKASLHEATMRALMLLIADESKARLAEARTAEEKIRAIVGANLSEAFFRPDICRAWLQFWALAPHHAALQDLERINASRLRSNLAFWLRPRLGREGARAIAEQVAAMIDGLWIHQALGETELHPAEAQAMVVNLIEGWPGDAPTEE